ncbi:MAG: N-acetyltransferase family protein [Gaiellaceae bacterium]
MSDRGSRPVRPLHPDEYPAFLARVQRGYINDMVVAGVDPEVAQAKSDRDHAALLTDGPTTPGHSFYVIEDQGEPAGYLWLAERDSDLGRNLFVYAVEVEESHRGRGLGRAAMQFTEEEARRRTIPKVALNVFGGNDVARGLYQSLGYHETAIYMEKSV